MDKKAEETVVLYRKTNKTVVAVVDKNLHYSHPADVSEYFGEIVDFLNENPEYTYIDFEE